ncbi:lactate utilization protein B [Roseiconus nitratireducens]|nr:lactate utilization protein B [Roseiconus nitratireducens]
MLPIVDHPDAAKPFVNDPNRSRWHDQALWFVRSKRDKQAHSIPEWEYLRDCASRIKTHTIANLAGYLEEFEKNATARGATVHWARDAEHHNEIVLNILRQHHTHRIVKSKSMLTEECGLNHYLEANDVEVVDTDLGERIVQLRGETPSHIVLPAIHIKKEEVGDTFHQHLGTDDGASDPSYLTEAARSHLRDKFLAGEVGITGVNFAIAETGGIVVCTNEGNADLGISLPKVHIACMGIEKLIPRQRDLGVFTRLLARAATGQPITSYTSHFYGPRDADSELHIVLVDNGRTRLRESEQFRASMHCIRCGSCMNTCPVYRRSGGHSYRATVPGPIGSVLSPTRDAESYKSLPYACSLCGSCTDVCPVKIPLHHQLLAWRGELVGKKLLPWSKRMSMTMASRIFQSPRLFNFTGSVGRTALRVLPRWMTHNRFNKWTVARDLPEPPKETFHDWYRRHRSK